MLLGALFIICGLLIIIVPQLLSVIVACMLIFWGLSTMVISYHWKKSEKSLGSPYVDFFIRF